MSLAAFFAMVAAALHFSFLVAALPIIDTQRPTIPGTPVTTSPTTNTNPAWTWTASTDNIAVAGYTFCWDTVSGGCANSIVITTNSFAHVVPLASGTWYAKVSASDLVGNVSG